MLKSNEISIENRHRAKILSSKVQVNERWKLENDTRMKDYECQKKAYDVETKLFKLNEKCKNKFVDIITQNLANSELPSQMNIHGSIEYKSLQSHLTLTVLKNNASKVLGLELKSFVKLRSKRIVKRGKVTYVNIPQNKELLMKRCIDLKERTQSDCVFTCLTQPILLPIE